MWLSARRAYSGLPLSFITTSPLPNGAIGATYHLLFQALGGTPPYSCIVQSQVGSSNVWSFTGSPQLILSCTPTVAETDTLVILLSDSAGNSVPGTFVVTVSAINFVIDSSGQIVTDSSGQPVTSQ